MLSINFGHFASSFNYVRGVGVPSVKEETVTALFVLPDCSEIRGRWNYATIDDDSQDLTPCQFWKDLFID